jgi:hypothetical protein
MTDIALLGIRLRDRFRAVQAEIDRRRGAPYLKKLFRERLGHELDLEAPRTFSEKIQWRKLFDRRPDYPVISDKLRLRAWVADRLGRDCTDLFVPLRGATDDPEAIDFATLPPGLALKANHGSGWNILLPDGPGRDRDRIVRTCREWLVQGFNRRKHEWAYWSIPPRIVVEDLVKTADGGAPNDVKLFMFDGVCRIVQFDRGRGSPRHARVYMTPDWTDHGFLVGKVAKRDVPPRPACLDEILRLAETLATGFDFIRVDFLTTEERYYVNEMTVYSGGGLKPFDPPEADARIGAMWHLPDGSANG